MAHYGKIKVGEILSNRPLRLEVAEMLSRTEGELLADLRDEDDSSLLEDVFEEPVPDNLEYLTVSLVRDDPEDILQIARHTGLSVKEVAQTLRATHGATLITNIFTFRWLERPSKPAPLPEKTKPAKRAPGISSNQSSKALDPRVKPISKTGGRSANKVFIVHGHDEAAKETVARFLERLHLTVIILHEQPNRGKTIIEKFEEHSDVPFAVVLLTPDDKGYAVRLGGDEHHRARQNVVFELGYFMGKLGRGRVCALHKSSLELPSDYSGILYIPMEGSWKFELAKELKQVFPDIDMNGVI